MQPFSCMSSVIGGSLYFLASGCYPHQPMTSDIITFGCRLNTYESEVIRRAVGEADIAVFNTCAVTKEAERQAKQAIRRYSREHPGKQIFVTGCAAQINPKPYADIAGVTRVLGNEEKFKPDSYILSSSSCDLIAGSSLDAPLDPAIKSQDDDKFGNQKILVNDIMSVTETASHLVTSFEGRARAFVQVQNGCNHRCTFCIIPYGRGNSRSVPVGEIVKEVQGLVENGFKEVVITGVDITDYGKDLPGQPSLGNMLMRVLKLVPDLPRLRLSSVDVAEIDHDLLDLIANEPRLMPHLHISMQAGNFKAHETPPFAPRYPRFLRPSSPPAPRCRLRRRYHHRLSHRNRGTFPKHI